MLCAFPEKFVFLVVSCAFTATSSFLSDAHDVKLMMLHIFIPNLQDNNMIMPYHHNMIVLK